MDELNTSSALTYLNERIDLVELTVPAQSTLDRLALRIVVVFLIGDLLVHAASWRANVWLGFLLLLVRVSLRHFV